MCVCVGTGDGKYKVVLLLVLLILLVHLFLLLNLLLLLCLFFFFLLASSFDQPASTVLPTRRSVASSSGATSVRATELLRHPLHKSFSCRGDTMPHAADVTLQGVPLLFMEKSEK